MAVLDGYQARAIDEQADLIIKIEKLSVYLASPESRMINVADSTLLRLQLCFMRKYSSILQLRINRFL
jgi:hypothetical protein